MDPLGNMYLQVEALCSDVILSGLQNAGSVEESTESSSTDTTPSSSLKTINLKTCTRPSLKDSWIPSAIVPRILGVLAFIVPIAGAIVQFSVSLAHPEYYADGDSGVHVPGSFAIGDTLRKSPTHYTGMAFIAATCGILLGIGFFRHQQIMNLCHPLFPDMFKKALRSEVLGISFFFFAIMASTVPPQGDCSVRSKGHLACWLAAVFSLASYGYTQIVQVEGTLMSHELIGSNMRMLRVKLMIHSLICFLIFIPLILMRDCLGSGSDNKEYDQGGDFPVLGTLVLVFQMMAVLLPMAIFGLTDFASMPYNAIRLHELQMVWKKSRVPIKVMVRGQGIKEGTPGYV